MAEIEIRLGSVMGGGGELRVSAELDADGRVWVLIHAVPFEGRGSVLVRLRVDTLDNLESLIADARLAAAKLRGITR